MLAIVNGGAAVAVLTYLGNLASHAASGQSAVHITPALMCYCGGLLATVIAFVLGYVVQFQLYMTTKQCLSCGATGATVDAFVADPTSCSMFIGNTLPASTRSVVSPATIS